MVVLSLEGPFAAPVPHAPRPGGRSCQQRQVKVYLTPTTRFEDGQCGERRRTREASAQLLRLRGKGTQEK